MSMDRDEDEATEDFAAQPPEPAPEPRASGWREVALFVCARCGRERRSQAHLDMVCRICHGASQK